MSAIENNIQVTNEQRLIIAFGLVCVCVCVCVCVRVFIFREGIIATLSYSGVLPPIRFRAKKLGYLDPHPSHLLCLFVLFRGRQQALQVRGVYRAGGGITRVCVCVCGGGTTLARVHTYIHILYREKINVWGDKPTAPTPPVETASATSSSPT